jgi:hypothetical protein
MSLIESLIGSGIVRNDTKRILPTRRPLFQRPRDVFEIIVALGAEATLPSLFHCVDLKPADPRSLANVVLNRWLTEEEIAAIPTPYRPQQHLRDMLTGPEFRASLLRRLCDSYPERTRHFLVRIPRCAGEHFLTMAGSMHPIYPNALATWRPRDENRFIPALGAYLAQFTLTRSIMAWQPTMAPFTQAPTPLDPSTSHDATGMRWTLNAPPRRTGDRLVAILREPHALILSAVNATIDALCRPPDADTPNIAALRRTLPANPATADAEGRKHIGREILRTLNLRNPICTAIADGTATGALRAARHQDLELADFSTYADWVKYTWDVEPAAPLNPSAPHLTRADLSAADLGHLHDRTAEDATFYTAFKAALSKIGDLRYSVRGRDL